MEMDIPFIRASRNFRRRSWGDTWLNRTKQSALEPWHLFPAWKHRISTSVWTDIWLLQAKEEDWESINILPALKCKIRNVSLLFLCKFPTLFWLICLPSPSLYPFSLFSFKRVYLNLYLSYDYQELRAIKRIEQNCTSNCP